MRLPTLPRRHVLPHHPSAHGEGLPPPFALVAVQDAAPAACLAVSRVVLPAPTDSTEDLDDLVRTEAVTVIPNDQLVDGICHGALHHDLNLRGVCSDRAPHQLCEAAARLAPTHPAGGRSRSL